MSDTMTIEATPSGVNIITDGRITFFHGYCDEGHSWWLMPDYRRGCMRVEHGENKEAVMFFDGPIEGPRDTEALFDSIEEWVDRCHEYEDAEPGRAAARCSACRHVWSDHRPGVGCTDIGGWDGHGWTGCGCDLEAPGRAADGG